MLNRKAALGTLPAFQEQPPYAHVNHFTFPFTIRPSNTTLDINISFFSPDILTKTGNLPERRCYREGKWKEEQQAGEAEGGETTNEMMAEAFRQIRQLTKHGTSNLEVKFQKENMFFHSFFVQLADNFLKTTVGIFPMVWQATVLNHAYSIQSCRSAVWKMLQTDRLLW